MAAEQHTVTLGDTLTPLLVQLQQKDANGVLDVVDLTGKVVTFFMVTSSGTTVVAETTEGVTVTDAAAGRVEYDFAAADVDTAGTFYGWFRVWDGDEYDTFPAGGRKLSILVVAAA